MSTNKLLSILKKQGLPPAQINEIMRTLAPAEEKREARVRATDWDWVLNPLRGQIKSLQSSKSKWSADPLREPVFSTYLLLLLKVRTRIETKRDLNLGHKTIPEVAAEMKLPQNGMRWTSWVPADVRHKVQLMFDHLYNVQLNDAVKSGRIQAVGKRLIPFSTAPERSVSESRWLSMQARLLSEKASREQQHGYGPYLQALDEALAAIHARGLKDIAPYVWTHLLSEGTRELYKAWRDDTLDGLDTATLDKLHAEASREYTARTEQKLVDKVMRKEEAARRRRNAAREAARERRLRKGMKPRSQEIYNAQDGRILADALAAVMVPEENDRWLRETLGDDAPAPAFTTPACGAEKSSAGEQTKGWAPADED